MSDIPSPVPAPGHGVPAPPVSRAIYGMPMFATLLVADVEASTFWYVDGLGFISLFTIPGLSDPTLTHLRRWQFQDLLVRSATGAVKATSSCSPSFAAVFDEIDVLATRARAHGGGRVEGPIDTPWNTRDVATTDPDGNVVIFTAARPQTRQTAGSASRCTAGTRSKAPPRIECVHDRSRRAACLTLQRVEAAS